MNELRGTIEAIMFVTDEPLSARRLSGFVDADEEEILNILRDIQNDLKAEQRGWQLRESAGGFRLYTHPAYAEAVETFVSSPGYRRISQAAFEVLSIVAYRQPLTRAGVADIRGVNSDSVISSLVDKGLLEEAGHEDAPGQPILYRTTKLFLEKFGLNSIDDLPSLAEFAVDEQTADQIRSRLTAEESTENNPFRALVD